MGYKSPGYILVPISHSALTPWVNSTTYFFGISNGAPIVNEGRHRVYVPRAGIIVGAYLSEYCGTTAGSNEAWPMVIRKNETTDYVFDTQSVNTNQRNWSNQDLNIPVVVGDYFEIKSVTPAWATPPSNGSGYGAQGYLLLMVE